MIATHSNKVQSFGDSKQNIIEWVVYYSYTDFYYLAPGQT